MTCTERMRNEVIDELMVDAGLWHAPEVLATLHSLASLATFKPPQPDAELAAMLAGRPVGLATVITTAELTIVPPAPGNPDELARRRWLRKNRHVVVSAAVLTAMGLGIGGVAAATAGLPEGQGNIFQRLISQLAPAWAPAPPAIQHPLPSPDSPGVATVPSSGAVPSNGPATGPASNVPGQGASQGASGDQQGSGVGPTQGAKTGPAKPGETEDKDGKAGKVPVQGAAEGAAASSNPTKAVVIDPAAPLVRLKALEAMGPVGAQSLPPWFLSLTAR